METARGNLAALTGAQGGKEAHVGARKRMCAQGKGRHNGAWGAGCHLWVAGVLYLCGVGNRWDELCFHGSRSVFT